MTENTNDKKFVYDVTYGGHMAAMPNYTHEGPIFVCSNDDIQVFYDTAFDVGGEGVHFMNVEDEDIDFLCLGDWTEAEAEEKKELYGWSDEDFAKNKALAEKLYQEYDGCYDTIDEAIEALAKADLAYITKKPYSGDED